ncbi:hypothetical protein [Mycolicibacterium komossense]|uniref:HNH endonuclease n=1 Tax=Mycolicibacterium komossense TaxID=1779 RepID=A0ABT3CMG8_9MYCO|nr:hypothetical protein [Mycolicibacterium komossense]MCV7230635.1 hypothetical protein [Mycolicibacterium komossense]
MIELDDTWRRIYDANTAAGIATDWTLAERDQMEALAADMDRELQRYPVIHAWPTANGSQLQFWCTFCKDHHSHGRHGVPPEDRLGSPGSLLSERKWSEYLQMIDSCTFNGRGICSCPPGNGDGHRGTHCGNRSGAYYQHGYILHEVRPDDSRAIRKPTRAGGSTR